MQLGRWHGWYFLSTGAGLEQLHSQLLPPSRACTLTSACTLPTRAFVSTPTLLVLCPRPVPVAQAVLVRVMELELEQAVVPA